MNRFSRRRRQRKTFLGNLFLNPVFQNMSTVLSAVALSGFVFCGFLMFRFTDEEDLINRGKMQLAEGKVAWAKNTFQTLVTHHRNSYEGHLLLGQAYLQLDERRKAEQEFELAASLKQGGKGDNAPDIALSKVAMAKGDFAKAESILNKAWKANKKDKNVRQARFELYEQWGNALLDADGKDYGLIVEKYESALRHVGNHQDQQAVEEKLIEAIHAYTERLIASSEYDHAVYLLKLSLRYKYLPETLIQIAETYGRMKNLDESIEWYRKAFDVSPNVVGLRLTNVLVEKGQELVKAKKPDEAREYFDEADKISQQAKIPLENLYPVSISNVRFDTDIDGATGEFDPVIKLRLSNDSARDLNFLAVKAEFVSGNETLAVVTEQAASPDDPLPMKDKPKNDRTITLKPDTALNVHALQDGKVTVKISVAYREGSEATWKVKSIQEATVRSGRPTKTESKPV